MKVLYVISLLLLNATCFAQQKIGECVVNNKRVYFYDDNTWRYADGNINGKAAVYRPDVIKPTPAANVNVSEVVGTCGALTKKGTPCRRRVKGGGHCFQH